MKPRLPQPLSGLSPIQRQDERYQGRKMGKHKGIVPCTGAIFHSDQDECSRIESKPSQDCQRSPPETAMISPVIQPNPGMRETRRRCDVVRLADASQWCLGDHPFPKIASRRPQRRESLGTLIPGSSGRRRGGGWANMAKSTWERIESTCRSVLASTPYPSSLAERTLRQKVCADVRSSIA